MCARNHRENPRIIIIIMHNNQEYYVHELLLLSSSSFRILHSIFFIYRKKALFILFNLFIFVFVVEFHATVEMLRVWVCWVEKWKLAANKLDKVWIVCVCVWDAMPNRSLAIFKHQQHQWPRRREPGEPILWHRSASSIVWSPCAENHHTECSERLRRR